MSNGNAIHGYRIGAGPAGEPERGEAAPRIRVSFWCASKHETRPGFATDAVIPETWECPRCGSPAGQDEQNPPGRPRTEPYKTHLAYVKERRSPADAELILAEALARLRGTAPAGPAAPDVPSGTGGSASGCPGGTGGEPPAGNSRLPAGDHDGDAPPTTRRGRRGRAAAGPATGEYHEGRGGCGYLLTSRSHQEICLGQK